MRPLSWNGIFIEVVRPPLLFISDQLAILKKKWDTHAEHSSLERGQAGAVPTELSSVGKATTIMVLTLPCLAIFSLLALLVWQMSTLSHYELECCPQSPWGSSALTCTWCHGRRSCRSTSHLLCEDWAKGQLGCLSSRTVRVKNICPNRDGPRILHSVQPNNSEVISRFKLAETTSTGMDLGD